MGVVIKENVPCEIETPKKANSIRIHSIVKDEIVIDFGHATPINECKDFNVDVVARVSIAPKMIKEITARLLIAGMEYQEKFNTSIGLNVEKRDEDASVDRGE
ncbi:hypothetical protein [Sporomusa sphaeroides]|uniref:Uncharacterized protein n=1 Tax=Sporomusa sphaeroides DSM 2875 TaxID=1337886 RepID=A0ABP2C569_9FIRM|nr:hypothetical protein [Sporomusa sphaeroides]OLS58283.1 hypothetical protein SPSPH_18190 [Sporomusa sphaeroides DSM 2875]CVK17530.1 hypothetical protein SSPH_00164 [Sporomusa sphaeroides DSM 2875]